MALTVKERLLIFISAKHMGQVEFAERCGLSRGYVNNLKDAIHPSTLKKIADVFPELNTEWLVTGKGDMYKGHGGSVQNEELVRFYDILYRQQEKINRLETKIDIILKSIGK